MVVGQAASGEQAVEVVLRERPDIVLMDYSMTGIDGIEASHRILQAHHVCILLLTGHVRTDVEDEAMKTGISGYLAKPVTSALLLSAISEALERFYSSASANQDGLFRAE
jgi:two-component system response regulator YesN